MKNGWERTSSPHCQLGVDDAADRKPLKECGENKIRNDRRMRACRYIDGNKIIPYYVISTLVRVRFSLRFSSLTACLATAGWKAPKRHWLAQTSASLSLVCYLLLSSTSSSLSSPSPYVPQDLATRPRARMPEKIFPRRRHPSKRESAASRIFALFFRPLVHLSRPPTLSLFRSRCPPSIRSTIMKFFVALFHSLFQPYFFFSLFLSHQFNSINI